MEAAVLAAMIAAGSAVAVAIIQALGNRAAAQERRSTEAYRAKREQAEKERKDLEEQRRQADITMQEARDGIIVSAGNLSLVTSIAVSGGEINGNVEAAQKAYTESLDAFNSTQGDLARQYLHQKK